MTKEAAIEAHELAERLGIVVGTDITPLRLVIEERNRLRGRVAGPDAPWEPIIERRPLYGPDGKVAAYEFRQHKDPPWPAETHTLQPGDGFTFEMRVEKEP